MKTCWSIVLASALSLAWASTGCASLNGTGNDDRDEKEQPVSLDQLPAAVKSTLMKEAGDGKVQEIERMTQRGRTVYEADVMMEGKKWELTVREDGQLLKKQLDEEDDPEDDTDDDDENEDD
jgi:hypothetical protein